MKNSSLNIVILRPGSPYQLDGVNVFIYELSEALIRLGHKVTVVGGFGTCDDEKLLEHFFDVGVIPNVVTLSHKNLKGVKRTFAWLTKGFKAIIDLSPDLIITNGSMPIPPLGFRIMRVHDLPKTFTSRIYMKLQSTFFDAVIVTTEELKNGLLRGLSISPKKCAVIPLPIDTRKYSPKPLEGREHAILFVDSRQRRNLEIALKAFNLIRKRDKKVKMYVVGFPKESIKSRENNDIVWLGVISKQGLRELYSNVKLLIFPSSYEGFGYPVLEAFSSGTPVVGSTAVPKSLLVDGYNGYRIPIYDFQQFAVRTLKLLQDAEKWEILSRNALTTSQCYDSLIIAKRYIELYNKHAKIM